MKAYDLKNQKEAKSPFKLENEGGGPFSLILFERQVELPGLALNEIGAN